MKPKKMIVLFLVVFILGVFIVRVPIKTPIEKELATKIYIDGEVVDNTTVMIKGEIVRDIVSSTQSFSGGLYIQCYERVCREDVQARIGWEKDGELQWLRFNQGGAPLKVDICREILINKTMEDVAIGFSDGRIVATSEEIMLEYQILNK